MAESDPEATKQNDPAAENTPPEPMADHMRNQTRLGGVPLDDFDAENYLVALRRDRLFDTTDGIEPDVGEGDWVHALDLDAEGDEDYILLDEKVPDLAIGDGDLSTDDCDELCHTYEQADCLQKTWSYKHNAGVALFVGDASSWEGTLPIAVFQPASRMDCTWHLAQTSSSGCEKDSDAG